MLTVDHREAVPRLGALGRLSTFRLPFARLRLFPAAIVVVVVSDCGWSI